MGRSLVSLGCVALLATAPLAAQVDLSLHRVDATLKATIVARTSDFVGVALISFAPDLADHLVGLPPLLVNFEVVGLGVSRQGKVDLTLPDVPLPPLAVDLYLQGVAISIADLSIDSSPVVKLSQVR